MGSKRRDPWQELVKESAAGIRAANEWITGIVDRAGGLAGKISAGQKCPRRILSPSVRPRRSGRKSSLVSRRSCVGCAASTITGSCSSYRGCAPVFRRCASVIRRWASPGCAAKRPTGGCSGARKEATTTIVSGWGAVGFPSVSCRMTSSGTLSSCTYCRICIDWLITTRTRYNFMRLFSARNDIKPGPILLLGAEGHIISDGRDPKMLVYG